MDIARDPQLMSIGQFGRATSLTVKALRLYDRKGILIPAHIDAESGYRYYQPYQMEDARLIRGLRNLDMPLDQIAVILSDPAQLDASVRAHIRRLEARLATIVSSARALVPDARSEDLDMEIGTRKMSQRTVLSVKQNVRVEGLMPFVKGSLDRLRSHAQANGVTVTDAPYGIFTDR